MKKLSLLILTILILGCGTEQPPSAVMEHKPIGHPLIADGTVQHGEVNVDPEPLNHSGFRFELTEHFLSYGVSLQEKDGKYLRWDFPFDHGWDDTHVLHIQRLGDYHFLKYDTEYELVITVLNYDCDPINIVIQFRTKPQRPLAGRPAPVIQQRSPVVPSGERFRFDPSAPAVVAGDVADGDNNVDPEPLNANGIQFVFDEAIKTYRIDLRDHKGASLNWLPHDLVNNDRGKRITHIQIMRADGAPLLKFDTVYKIDIFVEDFGCWTSEFKIVFRTKPKP